MSIRNYSPYNKSLVQRAEKAGNKFPTTDRLARATGWLGALLGDYKSIASLIRQISPIAQACLVEAGDEDEVWEAARETSARRIDKSFFNNGQTNYF